MMQSRRREHAGGSSGELDVFGATSYFAALLPPAPAAADDCASGVETEPSSADRLYFQAKVDSSNSFRSPHHQRQLAGDRDHAERHVTSNKLQLQVVAAKRRQPSGASGNKSKLAALLSFMVSPSPSPRPSFRKENKQEAPSSTVRLLRQAEVAASPAAAGGGDKREPADHTYCKAATVAATAAASSSSSSRRNSMQMQVLLGAHDDDGDGGLDLGVATGDRRLQGITVVRGRGGGEERWVVRCVPGPGGACWDWDDEERRDKVLDAESAASSEQNIKDEMVDVEEQLQGDDDDDGNNIDPAHSWDSDSSSDLFDLDLEYR